MKIIASSDIHVEKNGYEPLEMIAAQHADVLILGGDISNGFKNPRFNKAMDIASNFKGIRLAYLGNHEISYIANDLQNHYEELSTIYAEHGFHLLDAAPYTHDRVSFIGNVGWFDFSCYRKEFTPELEAVVKRIMRISYAMKDTSLAEKIYHTMQEHYEEVADKSNAVCIGIHHLFSQDMLLPQGGNEEWKDALMGSIQYANLFSLEKVVLGFTGHSHRKGEFNVQGKKVYNVSYMKNDPFTEVKL